MNNVRKRRLLQEYKRNLVNYFLVGCLFAGLPANVYLVEKGRTNDNGEAKAVSNIFEDRIAIIGNHKLLFTLLASTLDENVSKIAIIDKYKDRLLFPLASILDERVSKSEFNFDISFDDMPPYNGTIESSLAIARYVREKVKDVPNEVKYEYILNHFMLTPKQYKFLDAMVNKESTPYPGRYEDAFAVTTNIHNRICSYELCDDIKRWSQNIDPDKIDTSHYIIRTVIKGDATMIDHLIAPNQYQPYASKSYLKVLGQFDPESSQALLDALFVIDVAPYKMHPYLGFVGYGYESLRSGNVKFVPQGNNFSRPLEESDTIPLEERYYVKGIKALDNVSRKLTNR